jgi:hypothetical protein
MDEAIVSRVTPLSMHKPIWFGGSVKDVAGLPVQVQIVFVTFCETLF